MTKKECELTYDEKHAQHNPKMFFSFGEISSYLRELNFPLKKMKEVYCIVKFEKLD